MNPVATPLKFLGAGWFGSVMGLCGLALAWQRAIPLMGEMAGVAAAALGLVAALTFVLLLGFYLLRRQRYPQAAAEDFSHPVRHPFVATLPISWLLLAALLVATTGPSDFARGLWLLGSVWQFGVTVWLVSRWLKGGLSWAGVTPVLILPVVGNILVPLAGLPLGQVEWSAAQFAVGLFFWPLVVVLLLARLGVSGLWPDRLMATTFISVTPPAVVGSVALQWGAPVLLGWMAWGVALFFLFWSASAFKRVLAQPFSMVFWALSFPLASFCALTLQLARGASPGFQALAMIVLALSSLVVAALAAATIQGLRRGSLLVPEVVAVMNASTT